MFVLIVCWWLFALLLVVCFCLPVGLVCFKLLWRCFVFALFCVFRFKFVCYILCCFYCSVFVAFYLLCMICCVVWLRCLFYWCLAILRCV